MKIVMRSGATKEGEGNGEGKPKEWVILEETIVKIPKMETVTTTQGRNGVIPLSLVPLWSDGMGVMLGIGAVILLGKVIESHFASKGNYEVAEGVGELTSFTLKLGAFGGVLWLLSQLLKGGLFFL